MAFLRALLILGAALVLGSAQGASAADLYGGGGSLKDAPMAAPIAYSGAAWYGRVDGGYSTYDDPTITESGIYDLTDTGIDNTWSVGGGVGRYFTDSLRGDVTVDYRFESDVTGDLQTGCCHGLHTFGLKSTVVLANLYYDFDRGGRFSPYIGVGLGFTHNKTTEGTVDSSCGCDATIDSGSNNHVAAAAMAGVTVRLRGGETSYAGGGMKDAPIAISSSRGLYLDVGYRFLYLGDAETGAVIAPTATIAEDPKVSDIHAHELRFGLRYDLN